MHRSAAVATSHAGAFPPYLGRRQQQQQQQPPHVVLYVVRHGESTGNREGVLQGQMDYPLTEIGRAQAVATGRRLRAEAEEALADGAADTSSSGGSSSRGSEQASEPPPPIAFFHRIFSSDLSRARETAELIVQELLDRQHGGDGGGEQAASAAAEGVIGFDRDLREILGGVREGRPLGTSTKAAARQAAREQGVPLEAFVPPPYETVKDLRRRARRFVEKVLTEVHASLFGADDTDPSQEERPHRRGGGGSGGRRGFPSALMLASPFRSSSSSKAPPPRDDDVGGDEEQRPPLPVRILIVSHGGLLLQMFQKVFNLHAVTRVLNASLTVVEAHLPTSHPAAHPHHASATTTATNNNRRRLALIFASPVSSRAQPQTRAEGEEEEEEASAPLAAATAFRPVRINDVAHLEARKIVTTKSTAL